MNGALWAAIAPEIVLAAAGCVILLAEAFFPRLRSAFTGLAVAAIAGAGWLVWELPAGRSFGGLLEASRATAIGSLIVLVSAALALLASQAYLRREGILAGEYHALFLWCATGLLLMLRSTELLTVFVSLELLSLCLYALAAFNRKVVVGSEAALKYFLMGAFASAFLLYGIALLYGATGSTAFAGIAQAFADGGLPATQEAIAAFGILLLIAGFGFKMSLMPFHGWAPDTYQGSPSPFVGFLSVAPKAASAFVLVRILATVFPDALGTHWPTVIATLAVVSMVGGNLLALVQKDIKRMLAYSGIGHMGYLLIPLAGLDLGRGVGATAGGTSWTPILVYLAAYALMNAGAFAVVSMLYARAGEQHLISDLSGWGFRFPLLGACLTVSMLSLGGIPPTLGFLGKYLVFLHAVSHGQVWLALVGVGTSIVGVFYYLRVVYVLYMKDEVRAPAGLAIDGWGKTAVVLAALGTLVLGIVPAWLLDLL